MGKAVLTFDQMEIINKKSDTEHSDNDWLIITWSVQDKANVRTDTIPLRNTDNSVILDSGNIIAPVLTEVACNDGDLVSAFFTVVNLGSTDFPEQIDAAGKIAKEVARGMAEAYVQAAEFVVRNSDIPLSQVFADGIEEVRPAIVDAAGTAVDRVIVPAVKFIVDEINILLGHPNCNGLVFYDVAMFGPRAPAADLTTWRTYTASTMTGCGSPAKTSVHFTQQRVLSVPQQFSNDPPLKVSARAAHGQSPAKWLGVWAEDPSTASPLIQVTVSNSMKASGLLFISILEKVDPRYDVNFETGADPKSPEETYVIPFLENVFGQVKGWINLHVKPGNLQVINSAMQLAGAPGTQTPLKDASATRKVGVRPNLSALPGVSAVQSSSAIRLGWTRPQSAGISTIHFGREIPSIDHDHLAVTADAFQIFNQGVTVALYEFYDEDKDTVVGHCLRYTRNESPSYTRADVMLVKFNPVK